ncbi:hypothetical protein D6833_11165 [Candidatus Parcubacteria bacterium]|nr:MAG: hypothetical protein D6833_11165 [Candidatus Parcubacteria bacterium]
MVPPDFAESLTKLSRVAWLSRQTLNASRNIVLNAFSRKPPGPRPGARRRADLAKSLAEANARIAERQEENSRLHDQLSHAIVVNQAFIAKRILILVVLPFSTRDIQWVLAGILGQEQDPSKSTIARLTQKFWGACSVPPHASQARSGSTRYQPHRRRDLLF